MSYDPKTALDMHPDARLRRDITLLSDEQKTKLFDESIGHLPDSDKPGLAVMVTKPTGAEDNKLVDDIGDVDKAKTADYVALRLPPDRKAKISERVAEMLKENEENAQSTKSSKSKTEDDGAKTHAQSGHTKTHAHASR